MSKQTNSWDRYWAHGFLTSCADAFKGNYEGTMLANWQRVFSDLEDGARILDICTGNGAIALIAAAQARDNDKHFEIDALDSAFIFPERAVDEAGAVLLGDIHFHPNTDAAQTPFSDGCFDLITGHFALEYTDIDKVITELGRITKREARLHFVMHHSDSVILNTTREEQAHIALLFEKTRLFDRAEDFLKVIATVAPANRSSLKNDNAAENKRLALNAAAAEISAAIDRANHPEMLRTALGCISEAYRTVDTVGFPAAQQLLHNGRGEIAANTERLKDLSAAARSQQDIDSLIKQMNAAGFAKCSVELLNDSEAGLIGWVVSGYRGI